MDEENIKHNEILKAVGDLSEKTDTILEAIGHFSDKTEERFDAVDKRFEGVDKRFDAVDKRFDAVDKRFEGVDKRFEGVDKRFEGVEKRLDRIESNMVTKDYLDDKLSDLHGDLTVLIRKEDHKLAHLVNILETRKVISPQDANAIFALEPFPHLQ